MNRVKGAPKPRGRLNPRRGWLRGRRYSEEKSSRGRQTHSGTRVAINGKQFKSVREATEKTFGRINGKRRPGYAGVRYVLQAKIVGGQVYGKNMPLRVTLRRLRKWCLATGNRIEVFRRGLWVTA